MHFFSNKKTIYIEGITRATLVGEWTKTSHLTNQNKTRAQTYIQTSDQINNECELLFLQTKTIRNAVY